ncbi:MAG: SDR family oxidoreductase [Clostridiales bacterium]|nr:SDR family oxidoreductase [Clostridiales bacterium]
MQRVLITGGSRGIGKATVSIFEQKGYLVIAPVRQELDLFDSDSIERFIAKHKDITFDIIINNAGCNDINYIEDITDEELQKMIRINLIAPIMLLRSLVCNMKKQHLGRIVNIGSIWGIVAKPGRTVYSATKHGIHGVTKTLAAELAKDNILVNTVCPGYTLTEMTKENNSEKQISDISEYIPMKRMAKPEEIAEVIYFLCSNQNTYITGQKIIVDGGYSSI